MPETGKEAEAVGKPQGAVVMKIFLPKPVRYRRLGRYRHQCGVRMHHADCGVKSRIGNSGIGRARVPATSSRKTWTLIDFAETGMETVERLRFREKKLIGLSTPGV